MRIVLQIASGVLGALTAFILSSSYGRRTAIVRDAAFPS